VLISRAHYLHLLMLVCIGTVDEESSVGTEGRDWFAYWRLLFAEVHESDIVNFETKYKGNFSYLT